jgi:hypothetical protein
MAIGIFPTDSSWGGDVPRVWFRPWGWVHRPVSAPRTLLLLLALAFCIQLFVAVDSHSHSVSDTLYGIQAAVAMATGRTLASD